MPEEPPVPAWVEAWHDARWNIAILAVLLAVVTGVFVFQAPLSRSRRAHRLVRNAVLLFVLVWLGWTVSVQLSIVNVINYLEAPFRGFDAGFYLAEPLMVIIAAYTLISVRADRARRVLRLAVPVRRPAGTARPGLARARAAAMEPVGGAGEAPVARQVHRRRRRAGAGADLDRHRPARRPRSSRSRPPSPRNSPAPGPTCSMPASLLAIGLFSERAYCRFLCPLGGVLAVLDRLHLIDLLKRRPECGSPCRLCERACPVRAIEKSGKIITAECFQCLDCQVEYYDDKRCPPLVQAAKRRGSIDVARRFRWRQW